MSHELMDSNRFLERYGSAGRAWHGLGTTIRQDENITVADAMKRAGLDYSVIKVPELAQLPDGTIEPTGQHLVYREAHTYQGVVTPGKFISRNPVSDSYTIIDNLRIAEVMEPLAQTWPVETVGAIKDGAVVFLTLDGGEFDIKGDPHQMYFLVSDGKDGLRSLRVDTTPVRVVCANTLRMGIQASSLNVKIEHNSNATRELSFWAEVIPQIRNSAIRTKQALELLADTKATKAHAEQVFDAAFPAPRKSEMIRYADTVALNLSEGSAETLASALKDNEYHSDRMESIKALAWERYDIFNQQNPDTARTLFAVFQAANEVSNWRNGHEKNNSVDTSIVFGSRADESKRASAEAIKIATKGKGLVTV